MLPDYLVERSVVLCIPNLDNVIASSLIIKEFESNGIPSSLHIVDSDVLRKLIVSDNYVLTGIGLPPPPKVMGEVISLVISDEGGTSYLINSEGDVRILELIKPVPSSYVRFISQLLKIGRHVSEPLIMLIEGSSPNLSSDKVIKASLAMYRDVKALYSVVAYVLSGDTSSLRSLIEEYVERYEANEARYVAEIDGRSIKLDSYVLTYYDTFTEERTYINEVVERYLSVGMGMILIGCRSDLAVKLELVNVRRNDTESIINLFRGLIKETAVINDVIRLYLRYPYPKVQDVIKELMSHFRSSVVGNRP